MSKTFNPSPVLDHLGGALSIVVMAGLTFASAAIGAASPRTPTPLQPAAVAQLPPVIVTVKRAPTLAQLPPVIVIAQRATSSTGA